MGFPVDCLLHCTAPVQVLLGRCEAAHWGSLLTPVTQTRSTQTHSECRVRKEACCARRAETGGMQRASISQPFSPPALEIMSKKLHNTGVCPEFPPGLRSLLLVCYCSLVTLLAMLVGKMGRCRTGARWKNAVFQTLPLFFSHLGIPSKKHPSEGRVGKKTTERH